MRVEPIVAIASWRQWFEERCRLGEPEGQLLITGTEILLSLAKGVTERCGTTGSFFEGQHPVCAVYRSMSLRNIDNPSDTTFKTRHLGIVCNKSPLFASGTYLSIGIRRRTRP